ncbi:MAG: 4Fe-4S dicluster domain-containing protein [Deltaproteobacteria bacterium]|nr:4Fe-4S dicluster domain-containing protein [Deltaproteobacteria bacterium]
MTVKLFSKEEWISTLKGVQDSCRIFVPAENGDYHSFLDLKDDVEPDFGFQNSRLSAKAVVFPQSERMFEFKVGGDDPEADILKDAPKDYSFQAVVGIRPCDAHGFQIVKRNFDNPEYQDPWWVKRYESTILVGLGCGNPCSTCFCTSVGGGPFDETNLDVLLYDLGDRMLAKGITGRGTDFLNSLSGGRDADDSDLEQAESLSAASSDKMGKNHVSTDQLRDKVVTELFDAGFWEDVAFSCINCGTCTFLCPTCWCFDIQDEVYNGQGDRIRNWDTCMSPLFTLEGSGHNPRQNKFQRVRQRFMHKLKYYVDKYESGVQCSGCGRCVRFCPVNIDIRRVAEMMNSFKKQSNT